MSSRPFEPFAYISSHPQGFPYGGVEPTPEFVREVADMLRDPGDERMVARWVAERIEEYGSQYARLVFDLQGNGPFCSHCGSIAGVCGHLERAIGDDEGRTEVGA